MKATFILSGMAGESETNTQRHRIMTAEQASIPCPRLKCPSLGSRATVASVLKDA